MGAVDVRVGHDDDAVVAQLFGLVVVLAHAAVPVPSAVMRVAICSEAVSLSKRARSTLSTLPRSGRIAWNFAVAALLWRNRRRSHPRRCRSRTGRGRFPAVGELAGQATPSSTPLRRVISGGGRLRGSARLRRSCRRWSWRRWGFRAGIRRVSGHRLFAGGPSERPASSWSGWRTWGRHLDRQHAGEAFAHVVAGDVDPGLSWRSRFRRCTCRDDAGHRGAQAGEVGAAVRLGMLLVKHSTCS